MNRPANDPEEIPPIAWVIVQMALAIAIVAGITVVVWYVLGNAL